jgi:hypothetical protein
VSAVPKPLAESKMPAPAPVFPGELVARARELDTQHRELTGRPISRDTLRADLAANPSLFVAGLRGTGKPTRIQRMLSYLAARAATPLVLGDLKPDYADSVGYLGGQVIPIGRGADGLNVLADDPVHGRHHPHLE